MQKDQNNVTTRDLNYYLMKIQKPVIIALFAVALIFFVYSLMFMTPFYKIYLLNKDTIANMEIVQFAESLKAMHPDMFVAGTNDIDYAGLQALEKEAGEIVTLSRKGNPNGIRLSWFVSFVGSSQIHVFNHWLFRFSIIGIVVSLVLFIYRFTKRKRYYVTNFVTFAGVIGFNLFVAISFLKQLTHWNEVSNEVKYGFINAHLTYTNDATATTIVEYYKAKDFQWIFNVGYGVFGAVIAIMVIATVFVGLKLYYQLTHEAIDTSGVNIDE